MALLIAREKHRAKRDWLRWLTLRRTLARVALYRLIKLAEWYELDEIENQPGVGVCELLDAAKDNVDNEEVDNEDKDVDQDGDEDGDEDGDQDNNDEEVAAEDVDTEATEKVSTPPQAAEKNGKKTPPPPSGAGSERKKRSRPSPDDVVLLPDSSYCS